MNWREERALLNKWLDKRDTKKRTGMAVVTERVKVNQRKKRNVEAVQRWIKKHPREYREILRKRKEARVRKQNESPSPHLIRRRAQDEILRHFFLSLK